MRTLTIVPCARCGREFPRSSQKPKQRYCSHACANGESRLKQTQLRAEGRDPLHGGAAAEKRRAAIRRQRAEGNGPERIRWGTKRDAPTASATAGTNAASASSVNGRSLQAGAAEPQPRDRRRADLSVPVWLVQEHVQDATRDAPSASLPSPSSISVGPSSPERDGADYLSAGMRYERLAAKALWAENGRQDTLSTLVLAGYGAGIRVERDALIVAEGHTHNPQTPITHTLYRGMHSVERIICLGPSGSVSFPAVQWCAEQCIALLLLARDGSLLSAFTPEAKADATLRRAQYLAQSIGQDVVIARELIRRKLMGQFVTLETHRELPGGARGLEMLGDALSWLKLPEPPPWLSDLDTLRTFEGRAAQAYFASWRGYALRWTKADTRRVPPHWARVRERNSPLSQNARRAVDPCNAVLNYAYALLEGQCRQALTRLGFDVACGFLHVDKASRDSLVYDLMECERGAVDGLMLDFLGRTTLHYGDVTPVSDGSCRLHPQLARAVVAACHLPQDQIDEDAKWLHSLVMGKAVAP